MEKIIRTISVCVLASVAIAGCSMKEVLVEDSEQNAPKAREGETTFTACWESTDSKTTISNGEGNARIVEWEVGDSVKIMTLNENGELVCTPATATVAGVTTVFNASVPESDVYYAVHPYSTPVSIDANGVLTVSAPTQDGSFSNANVCIAKTTAAVRNFEFKNVFAIIRFTTASDKITRIDIADMARANTISGKVQASFADDGSVQMSTMDGTYFYRKELPVGNKEHFVAVSPGTYEQGLAFVFEAGEEMIPAWPSSKAVPELTRTTILNCGEVDTKSVRDLYVAPTGSGDGSSESSPMGFDQWIEIICYTCPEGEADYFAKSLSVAGRIYHFAPGTYTVPSGTSTLFSGPFGSFSSNGVPFTIIGSEGTVFTGSRFLINSYARAYISNISFDGCEFSTGGAMSIQTARGVILKNCVFKNNIAHSSAGALYISGGTVRAEDCKFLDNSADNYGGAMYINSRESGSSTILTDATFINCEFSGNSSGDTSGGCLVTSAGSGQAEFIDCKFLHNTSMTNGGAIRNNAVMILRNCLFEGNEAKGKGASDQAGTGGALYTGSDDSDLKAIGCTFRANRTTDEKATYGGAVNVQAKALTALFEDCIFEDNCAKTTGGGINVAGVGPVVTVTGCTFQRDTAITNGGGIYVAANADVNVENTKFLKNVAACGSAICSYGNVTMKDFEIREGTATNAGGGIRIYKSRMILSDGIIDGCITTSNSGGALYLGDDNGSLEATNVTFSNNKSKTTGGAINFQNKKITGKFTGCQFIGNEAATSGGAFNVAGGAANFTFEDCLFKDNVAGTNGGVAYITLAPTMLNNCVMENNSASKGGAIYCGTGKCFMNACVLKGNSCTASDASSANAVVITSGEGYIGVNNCTIYTDAAAQGIADVRFGGTSGPYGAVTNCTMVSECSVEGHITFDCPYEAVAGGISSVCVMGNVIQERGGSAAVGGFLMSKGYNVVSGGSFYNVDATDSVSSPDLSASPSQSALTHFIWNATGVNKASAAQVSEGIASSVPSDDILVSYNAFLSKYKALEKDQIGNARDAAAFTPGSIQL